MAKSLGFKLPPSTKAIIIKKSENFKKSLYHDAALVELPLAPPGPAEVMVKINATGFNHREVWIRKGQYPAINFGGVMGADGAGTVIASGRPNDPLLNTRVFLNPIRGWHDHPDAPESQFGTVGGTTYPKIGTFCEYIVVERDHVLPTPAHLDDIHAATWPVAGITSWRAVAVNAQVQAGQNVLITGIGGGVALVAMQLCLAMSANVFVTSGSQDKIQKAVSLGAKGGVNYKEDDWPKKLEILLHEHDNKNSKLDAVIDSAGGDLMNQLRRTLKRGGKVVCYGMTASPKITFTMRDVLANQKLIGSTLGSLKDLKDATEFIAQHRVTPVVSHVVEGLEAAEEGFELMKSGNQFGKIVIALDSSNTHSGLRLSKL
ncbi:hypothetical protein CPB83DRAFT_867255 [Crepidotus variabilis]|uniref:Enoyl reductase (ER) domain-containing protein n=1 Tax=Crepidotus variabilis TaxID=179855 RepID=A0A9P6EN52_9AGAR|nr:hypothetical protein CPB83DRAFT_867255 [Crepidotus variabilis]